LAKIDEVKEEINYLKVWLSILVITMFVMIGWGVSNIGKVNDIILILNVIGIITLSLAVIMINFAIIKKLKV